MRTSLVEDEDSRSEGGRYAACSKTSAPPWFAELSSSELARPVGGAVPVMSGRVSARPFGLGLVVDLACDSVNFVTVEDAKAGADRSPDLVRTLGTQGRGVSGEGRLPLL